MKLLSTLVTLLGITLFFAGCTKTEPAAKPKKDAPAAGGTAAPVGDAGKKDDAKPADDAKKDDAKPAGDAKKDDAKPAGDAKKEDAKPKAP